MRSKKLTVSYTLVYRTMLNTENNDSDHLLKRGLPSRELRRLHLDLVCCYKMVFGLVKLNFYDFFEFSVSPTRGHAYKLYKYRRKSVRADFLHAEW